MIIDSRSDVYTKFRMNPRLWLYATCAAIRAAHAANQRAAEDAAVQHAAL